MKLTIVQGRIMLVLTRQVGEKIILEVQPSDKPIEIEVCLVKMELGQSRIGIEAPKHLVNVVREELRTSSIGQITPNGMVNAIRNAIPGDDDCEPDPKYMTPVQRVGWYTNEARKNHHHED